MAFQIVNRGPELQGPLRSIIMACQVNRLLLPAIKVGMKIMFSVMSVCHSVCPQRGDPT